MVMNKQPNRLFYRFKKAFAFSDRYQIQNTVLNLIERKLQKIKVKSMPFIVQADVTNRCNLNCIFCSRDELKLGDLPSSLLPEIVKLSRKSRELILFGYGEPLISERFHTLYKISKSARISFTTNGLLLSKEMIEKIIKEGSRPIDNITFSIDGATDETYSSIRKKSNFQTVWANLKYLSEYKKHFNMVLPEIWINFVAMKRNVKELPQLIEKASKVGVSQINVFHMNVWEEAHIKESLIYCPELTKEIFSRAKNKANELGLKLDVPVEISENQYRKSSKNGNCQTPKCYQPWSYCYIRNDGLVQACCYSEDLIMGNLLKQSFEEIWNGKLYHALRASVNKTPLADCQRCELRFRHVSSPNDYETYIKLKPRTK